MVEDAHLGRTADQARERQHRHLILHNLNFFAHNAGVGEFVAGAQSVDGSRAWNGLYDGELGTTRLVGRDSRFAITALDEETVSGTFLAVLENGPAFLDGVFTDLQIYDR